MFFQPKVSPLPPGIDLSGKTAVITGASAGIGLETTRQLLQLKCTTVILAVRNVSKGKACVRELRQDPIIKANNPTIKVLYLDMELDNSIQDFSRTLQQEVPQVDILILNAGISTFRMERTPNNHEKCLQINYLSNVLLLATLLPYLNASAEKTGSPTRVTWVGSRMHERNHSFEKSPPLATSSSIFAHMDSEAQFRFDLRYGDTKLPCAMFMYELVSRLDGDNILLNMVCPGQIHTGMTDYLPFYVRGPVALIKALRARPVEVGGWCIVHAAVVAGRECHGRFLGDKEVLEVSKYIRSSAGKEVQKALWVETMEEMGRLTALPAEFRE